VPTPDVTVSTMPPLLSSAIIPPRRLTLHYERSTPAPRRAWYAYFYGAAAVALTRADTGTYAARIGREDA